MHGDGETESMTQGQCGICGATLDSAAACGCRTAVSTPAPLAVDAPLEAIAAAEPSSAAATPQIDVLPPAKSEAALRFGWDPAMPDEPAPVPVPAAASVPDDSHKTVREAPLPEPELEALFAALEASPIRIKASTPETAAMPEPVQPLQEAPAEPPAAVAPIAFEPAAAFEERAPLSSHAHAPADILAPAEVSATINLQAAINAAAFEAPDAIVPPPLQQPLESAHVFAEAAANEPMTPAAEEIAFEPITVRMPVFDALPPVVPAHLASAVPAEPTAAAPSPAAAPIAAALPLQIDDVPVFAAPVEPPVVMEAAPAPASSLAGEPAVAAAPRAGAKAEAKQEARAETKPAIKPSAAPSNRRSLVTAALAVVILGAIGVPLSRLWLGRAAAQPAVQQTAVQPPAPQPAPQRPAPASHSETPAPVAAPSPVPTPAPAAPPIATPAPVPARTSPAAAPAATAPARPAAAQAPRPAAMNPDMVAAARTRPQPRPQPSAAPAPQPAPSLATLAPAIVAPAPAVTALPSAPVEAPPAPVPAAEPPSSTPAAGPFFELNDVDRAPRVATRVDADLPVSLEGQAINEIVVVRVLVSQTGRPALVSLLRHSKAGLALDEAVIAAVKQWTFTPAVKRGQTVSCFYHVGVPVKGAR